MTEPRLLHEPRFVICREPDRTVRLALRLVSRANIRTGNVILDANGQGLGSVREIRRWGFNLPDLELDVVDPGGELLLGLKGNKGKLHVSDAAGTEIGYVDWRNHWQNVRGHRLTDMDVSFVGPGGEVGRLASRLPPQHLQPRGRFEILDPSGTVVARTDWHDIVRHVVELPPTVKDPLRALVIGFACAQVDLDWFTYHPRLDNRT